LAKLSLVQWVKWAVGRVQARSLQYAFRFPMLRRLIGEICLRRRYARVFGRRLNLAAANSFTEKLFAKMIALNRHGDPLVTRLSDKFRARELIADRIGADHLIPLLWQGTDPDAIPFDDLPSTFMIKTNHGSGMNMAIRGDCDRREVVAFIRRCLKENYYWNLHEAQYYPIEPCIIVEQYLRHDSGHGPIVYRLWCFEGKTAVVQLGDGKPGFMSFHDPDWKILDFQYRPGRQRREFERPANLDELVETAERLAAGFDFVRVDLYSIDGHIYFGEMTFTPCAGEQLFEPPHWDLEFGRKWLMPTPGAMPAASAGDYPMVSARPAASRPEL
jgi:hypothetical protein